MPVEVRVEHVTKVFGAITAVAGVTLEIQRGEFFTLLGPSGSGKTTLLRIIAGLEGPSSGRVFIGGIDATDLPPNRRPTSTVFQDLALFPHMSVGQNVEYGLRLRGVSPAARQARAQAMLRLTDLDGFYDRDPNTLSGSTSDRGRNSWRASSARPTSCAGPSSRATATPSCSWGVRPSGCPARRPSPRANRR